LGLSVCQKAVLALPLTTAYGGYVPIADVQWSTTERQQWELKLLFIFVQW